MARDAASCAGTADPLVAFGECGGERGLVLDGGGDHHSVAAAPVGGPGAPVSVGCSESMIRKIPPKSPLARAR